MTDDLRNLRVEVQVLERAVHRFEERLAGLREEVTKGFDRLDIVLANQFGETLMLLNQADARLGALERKGDERHAELMALLRGLQH
jgi:hypothetical protein